jgi:hypothetical protein
MAAYGLYSHIQSNRRRSIALLVGLVMRLKMRASRLATRLMFSYPAFVDQKDVRGLASEHYRAESS